MLLADNCASSARIVTKNWQAFSTLVLPSLVDAK
jgi:hypothetical protein